jgi:hypothetical protein
MTVTDVATALEFPVASVTVARTWYDPGAP